MTRQQVETLVNVGVFAPLAIYALQGRRPPRWLVAGSLVYVVAVALIDGRQLLADWFGPVATPRSAIAPQGGTPLPAPQMQ